MARVEKYGGSAIQNLIRHNNRTIEKPSNPDIDLGLSYLNYKLHERALFSDYNYYLLRKNQLHTLNRGDVKTLCGWVVTAPKDLAPDQHERFFAECFSFLKHRYGEKNMVQAIVHNDESGQPHLHYCFIPAVPDHKHGGEKICAKEVLTRAELREFHPALQAHLLAAGIAARIINGATAAGNRTVKEMKRERALDRQRDRDIERGVFR